MADRHQGLDRYSKIKVAPKELERLLESDFSGEELRIAIEILAGAGSLNLRGIRRDEICMATGSDASSVERAVERLIAEGFITELSSSELVPVAAFSFRGPLAMRAQAIARQRRARCGDLNRMAA